MTTPATGPGVPVWAMYRALVGVGLACGLLIVSVHEATEPRIRANRVAARGEAVLAVLPGAVTSRAFMLGHRIVAAPVGAAGPLVFAGYAADGSLVGLSLEARAMGYQDVVRLVYGYAPGREQIVGLEILESRETPGLGDRVETDAAYVANFAALDVRVTADGVALARPIEIVKPGEKTAPHQIDTISGATITSTAVARMVADSAGRWVPVLRRHQRVFEAAGRRGGQ
jgi:electron transport complex protein RnfG